MRDDKRAPSDKGTHRNKPANNSTRKSPTYRNSTNEKPLKPDDSMTAYLMGLLPNENTQYASFLKILCTKPDALTGKCNPFAGVNLSSVASLLNKYIAGSGYVVDCRQPEKRKKNRFGNLSNEFLWGIYPE